MAEPIRDDVAPRDRGRARIRVDIPRGDIIAVVESNRRAVDRVVARGEGRELVTILRRTEDDLRRRLLAAHARGLAERWTGAHVAATRTMVMQAIIETRRCLDVLLRQQGRALSERAMFDVLRVLHLQERRFEGIVRPLALEQALRFEHVLRGVASSRLRQFEASVARYGTSMITEFERTMQIGIVGQRGVGEMIDALAAHGGPGGVFRQRRYLAERIVRTELLASYNLGAQAAMEEEREDFPDLQRIILAHHDRRTAQDSIFVHGEIRRLDEDFLDGAGRTYRVPPARPNDREVVIPWRPSWTVPAPFGRRPLPGSAAIPHALS